MKRSPRQLLHPALLGFLLFLVTGCSSWWQKDGEGEFSYNDPEPPPLERPEIVPTDKYLRTMPSGKLYHLNPARIAIVGLGDFGTGSDPIAYLRAAARKAKESGDSFLPYHYYVAPDGAVFEGQSDEFCGSLAGKRIPDTLIVGVLGNFNGTNFLGEDQEQILIQLCAWLCSQHSVRPQNIYPARTINPEMEPLGENLQNWFGPTQMLRNRVNQTLVKGAEVNAKQKEKEKGIVSTLIHGKPKPPPPEMTEDF